MFMCMTVNSYLSVRLVSNVLKISDLLAFSALILLNYFVIVLTLKEW